MSHPESLKIWDRKISYLSSMLQNKQKTYKICTFYIAGSVISIKENFSEYVILLRHCFYSAQFLEM